MHPHRRRKHGEVKNPYKGSLLERQIKRAIFCVENGSPDMYRWFKSETGMTPQQFIEKWEKILL